MHIYGNNKGYFYCKIKCNVKLTRRHGIILENSRISYKNSIILCRYYFNKTLIRKNILRDVGIRWGQITKKNKYKIENKIMLYNKGKSVKLAGIGSIIEVDECLMASVKYGKNRYTEQTWVFGIVNRGTKMLFKGCARSKKGI
ncbi:hypothetical protein DMUE_2921 [Dictyocoela muelleri]|nr:hypothetical protein DMUE_2921 [Dictyocoela muelleri]